MYVITIHRYRRTRRQVIRNTVLRTYVHYAVKRPLQLC